MAASQEETMKGPRRDVAKEARWRKLIGEATRSGMSVRAFCERRGLNENLFYAWRRELRTRCLERDGANRKKETGKTFALVSADGEGDRAGIEIVLEGGRKLRISRGVDAETLRTVVGALGEQAVC
jgi:transposase-like protein